MHHFLEQINSSEEAIDAWRSISLLVLKHGQQNCDFTVSTMRIITDESQDTQRTKLFDDALNLLKDRLEEQHQQIQTIISELKFDA